MIPVNFTSTFLSFSGPIALAIAVTSSFMLSSTSYGEVVSLTIIVYAASLLILYRGRIPYSPLHIALYLFTLYIVINPFWSINAYRSMSHVLVLCQIPLLFLLLSTDRVQKNWGNYLLLIAIPALISSVWGIAEYILTDQLNFVLIQHRVDGFLLDPNSFSAIQYIFSILLFSLLYIHTPQKKFVRWSIWLIQFLVITTLFLTLSRSGILIWLLCIFALLVYSFSKDNESLRKYLILHLLIALISFTSLQILAAQINQPLARNDLADGLLSLSQNGRFEIWEPTFRLIAERPLFGWGLDSYQSIYPSIRKEYYSSGRVVHNDYIQFTLEGGVILLLFLILFLGFHLYIIFRLFTKELSIADTKSGVELTLMLIANLALLLHSTTNFSFYIIQLCILSGIIFSRSYYLSVNIGLIKQESFIIFPHKTKIVLTLILTILMTPLLFRSISGFLFVESERYRLTNSLSTNITLLNAFTAISPQDHASSTKLVAVLASRLDAIADPGKKKQIFDYLISNIQRLITEYPYEASHYYNLGKLMQHAYSQLPDHNESYKQYASLWIKSIELDPAFIRPYLKLSEEHSSKKQYQQALSLLEQLIPWISNGRFSGENVLLIQELLLKYAKKIDDPLLPSYQQLSLSAKRGDVKGFYNTIRMIDQSMKGRKTSHEEDIQRISIPVDIRPQLPLKGQ